MIIRLAIRNLLLNGRRSMLMGLLIFVGVLAALFGNALFASAGSGLKKTFIECFTGDLYIAPPSDALVSLFGPDTPIIGSYAPIPVLPFHDRIRDLIGRLDGIASTASQISGYALLEVGASRNPVMLFGVSGEEYFRMFPSITITEGVGISSEPGAMLSGKMAADLERSVGHPVNVGDVVRLSTFEDRGFTIRQVPIVGFFTYPVDNTALDRIAYVDAATLRALNGMVRGDAPASSLPEGATDYLSGNLDDLFDAPGITGQSGEGISVLDVERSLSEPPAAGEVVPYGGGSWSFILIRLKPGAKAGSLKTVIERRLAAEGLSASVGDWMAAGGSGASLASSLRWVFNGGLALATILVVLILANSFVIWIAQRTTEIATMRALGASRAFVLALLFTEAAILGAAWGGAGVAVGSSIVLWLGQRGIVLANRILVLVFGGATLQPVLTPGMVVAYLLGSAGIGVLALLVPIRLALRLDPARAMEGE
jgi:putative ABC transport system permease protein